MSTPLAQEFAASLNFHGEDAKAETPDYILANYLVACLRALTDANASAQLHRRMALPASVSAQEPNDAGLDTS